MLCFPCGGKGAGLHPPHVAGEVRLPEGSTLWPLPLWWCHMEWFSPSQAFPGLWVWPQFLAEELQGLGLRLPFSKLGLSSLYTIGTHTLLQGQCRIWLSANPSCLSSPGSWEFLRLGFIRQITVLSACYVLLWWKEEGAWGVRRDPSAQAEGPRKRRCFSSPDPCSLRQWLSCTLWF